MLQVWKFFAPMAQISTTFQHVLRVLQTSIRSFTKFVFLDSLARMEGGASALFGNWKEWPCLLEKMLRLWVSMGKFLLKNPVLGVPTWKKPQHFPHKAFCLFVAAKMFLEVALFLETYSVLKTRCTLGRPPWLADKGNFHSFNDFILSKLTIKAYFSFTLHLEYLFATSLKNKQYTRQQQS